MHYSFSYSCSRLRSVLFSYFTYFWAYST